MSGAENTPSLLGVSMRSGAGFVTYSRRRPSSRCGQAAASVVRNGLSFPGICGAAFELCIVVGELDAPGPKLGSAVLLAAAASREGAVASQLHRAAVSRCHTPLQQGKSLSRWRGKLKHITSNPLVSTRELNPNPVSHAAPALLLWLGTFGCRP